MTSVIHARHTVAGTHDLQPAFMFRQFSRRLVADPAKQQRINDNNGKGEPPFQRRTIERHGDTRQFEGDKAGNHHQHQTRDKQTGAACPHQIQTHNHQHRGGRQHVYAHYAYPHSR